jgi:hypothetical protein
MGVYNTYFDKNNTIVKGSNVNTARNPISELYFGAKTSRFVFYCSFAELLNKVNNGDFNLSDVVSHKIKIKNTSNFDINPYLNLDQNITLGDTYLPSGFNVQLYYFNEDWDEGLGYDYNGDFDYLKDNLTYSELPSNWTGRTQVDAFSIPGIVTGSTNLLATQYVEKGYEDIELDVSEFVNIYLASGVSYKGFVLKFSDEYENGTYPDGVTYGVGLYTKNTNTFFQPYIQTIYNDTIKDDRNNAYVNKFNRLYLYSIINGEYVNLDNLPTVTVNNNTYTAIKARKGCYYIDLDCYGLNSYTEYSDIWSNLYYNELNLGIKTMKFVLKDANEYYLIGNDIPSKSDYGLNTSGIKYGEQINGGNIRTVTTIVKKAYTVGENILTNNLEYRLYVKQGKNNIVVFDWLEMDRIQNKHQFKIETACLIPQIYYVDIRLKIGGEVLIFDKQLKFEVLGN